MSEKSIIAKVDDSDLSFSVDSLPKNFNEFLDVYRQVNQSAPGVSACFVLLIRIFEDSFTEGMKCLAAVMDMTLHKHEIARLEEQIERYPGLLNTYFKGSGPDNGYHLPGEFMIEFKNIDEVEKGIFKVYLKTLGADSARPIRVKKGDNGDFKVQEYSSVIMGIKPVK